MRKGRSEDRYDERGREETRFAAQAYRRRQAFRIGIAKRSRGAACAVATSRARLPDLLRARQYAGQRAGGEHARPLAPSARPVPIAEPFAPSGGFERPDRELEPIGTGRTHGGAERAADPNGVAGGLQNPAHFPCPPGRPKARSSALRTRSCNARNSWACFRIKSSEPRGGSSGRRSRATARRRDRGTHPNPSGRTPCLLVPDAPRPSGLSPSAWSPCSCWP